ncbi:hypothetical protein CFE70_001200 [Pyrenophora teres f. teres 0-1]|uniref:Uncharacterized protein n=2 Tax=Pyrenophora teres f. teres TaxID=97479 RepID=E3S4B5_PYRTT|nr:hypothetical protein PTT_17369 [Pyrenophora teres f. teres 0-1]KAE8822682.1 hypothetical protein HRS9139_10022 [Pyrenophora teres f. teres]KAE8826188.1 hypothetical protein PTNB85_09133 [Pyrenophora teres f. teres]KAE8832800.1 hypothetical protein HRS9122_08513 [Pyrenophora teres f. teres]KAE8852752.1 hypothetical protein PTNB29_10142 [Pyrenophora teres f. teres]
MSDLNKSPVNLSAIIAWNAIESPLLRLPAEPRNKIYHYALGKAVHYDMRYPSAIMIASLKAYLVFLATCRQIHTKAGLIPFGNYRFCSSVGDLMAFRLRFSLIQLGAIRFLCLNASEGTLEFCASMWEEWGYAFLTALFPNLRKVVLNDQHLGEDYDDCIHYSKDALEMERQEWETFVR